MMPIREDQKTSRLWAWLLPLVALLLSATCVTSSTFLALSLSPAEISQAQMLAESQASYERDLLPVAFAPLDPQIIAAATRDSLALQQTPAAAAAYTPVAEIPVPLFPVVEATAVFLPTAAVTVATLTPLPPAPPITEPDRPTPRPTTTLLPGATTAPATTAATVTRPPTTAASPLPATTPTVMATTTATASTAPPTATLTASPWPMPTATPTQPSVATGPAPTHTPPAVPSTATSTPTASATATPLPTYTPTSTPTAVATPTPTATPMPTLTPTPTDTPTPVDTPTSTPTSTSTVPPCTGYIPDGEPNIGLPNGTLAVIGCGTSIVVDLGVTKVIEVAGGTEPAFDLVFYEFENPASTVHLDWIIVEVGASNSGPWYQVFYWGDGILDANSNIGQLGYGLSGEPDNQPIPFAHLYGGNSTGVAIDVDAVVPPGSYRWVRFTAPLGGDNDAAEVDSVDVLP